MPSVLHFSIDILSDWRTGLVIGLVLKVKFEHQIIFGDHFLVTNHFCDR